ncbi:MAG: Flp pilus assembly complex ATPase component TadA [Elusimicrobia bacterium]|nr:Flp pilus assembly complex ATPase component TadA [Elusimicrobiota bacterium]
MVIGPLKRQPISEILLNQGKITKEQLETAVRRQKETKQELGKVLISMGFIKKSDYLQAYAFQKGLTFKSLASVKIDEKLHNIISADMARRFTVIPISRSGNTVNLAMADPTNLIAIEEVEQQTGLKVSVVLSSDEDISKMIEKIYGGLAGLRDDLDGETVETLEDTDDGEIDFLEGEYAAEDAPIVKYVNSVLKEAVDTAASDVHLEPLEKGVALRLRIDGKLKEFPGPSRKAYPAVVSRIKIMANLNIAERRLPQDGKCKIKVADKKFDIRVSSLPTIHGEKIVMRILYRSNLALDLNELGFSIRELTSYKQALTNPHGMILVTGPTGSGKTTTLYAGLSQINKPERNIVTIEDPVEYELDNVNQVNVKPVIELNFANILRSVLRQDPDVIMVGEIRDRETAEIAIQASLTGHLVLSTLHTNDAISTLSRLKYMGVEPYLIADAVELVIAQRLVRKICPNCREEEKVPDNILRKLGIDQAGNMKFYHGKGCDECYGTGHKGRTAVYEIAVISQEIKKMIIAEASDIEIREKAVKEGMRTIRDLAKEKLVNGETTVEEVLTVTFG